jgi:Holliday junction resolvase
MNSNAAKIERGLVDYLKSQGVNVVKCNPTKDASHRQFNPELLQSDISGIARSRKADLPQK